MDKKDILKTLINHFDNGNKTKFARRLGITPQGLSTWLNRNTFDIDILFSKCENISAEWLLTGKGEMFKNDVRKENPINISGSSGTNITGGSIYNNTSNNSNNHISIILPENGYKKIINSTGKETTLKMSDDEMPVVESLSAENRFLKQRITDLEKIIETKDDIINMYKGLIKHS